MAFIGESRRTKDSPWNVYVCLDQKDCELIIDAIGKSVGRRLRSYEYFSDVMESGEATSKQQDKYAEAAANYETILSVQETIHKFVKIYKLKN